MTESPPDASPTVLESKAMATTRLRREGRFEAFTRRCDELRATCREQGMKRPAAAAEAWRLALLEFPPLPAAEPEAVPAASVSPASGKAANAWEGWQPPALPDISAAYEALPLSTQETLRGDYLWVFNHPALWRAGEGPDNEIFLIAADIVGCPSRSAWGLLHQAVKNPEAFCTKFSDRFLRLSDAGKPLVGSTGPETVGDEGLVSLEEMLERVRRNAWDQSVRDLTARVMRDATQAVREEVAKGIRDWKLGRELAVSDEAFSELMFIMCDVVGKLRRATTAADNA